MIDLGARFVDFDDAAAAVAEMDVVVTVDTSMAHLAGAMGKPVLLLLHYEAEWRWMEGNGVSAWYPTMGMFRQARPGDWAGVIERVKAELGHRHFAGPPTKVRD